MLSLLWMMVVDKEVRQDPRWWIFRSPYYNNPRRGEQVFALYLTRVASHESLSQGRQLRMVVLRRGMRWGLSNKGRRREVLFLLLLLLYIFSIYGSADFCYSGRSTAGSTLVVDHSLARPGENKRDVSPMAGWLVGVVAHVNKMRSE